MTSGGPHLAARYSLVVLLLAVLGAGWEAAPPGAASHAEGAGGGATATWRLEAGPCPGKPRSLCPRLPGLQNLTFASACFTSVPPPLIGPRTMFGGVTNQTLPGGKYSEGGHLEARDGFSIAWSGTHTGRSWAGVGHGTWSARDLPRSCDRSRGSASGRYRSVWTITPKRATVRFVFSGFPG